MEAFEGYWRKTPSVKRLVFKVVGDETTRLAALKRGEVDVVYSIRGKLAEAAHPRSKLVSRERASHWSTYADKKYRNLAYTASGAFGNAATRLEAYVIAGGTYVYGNYPELDSLFKDQAAELDRKKREALLHRIQQLMHEKTMHIPIWELAFCPEGETAAGARGGRC